MLRGKSDIELLDLYTSSQDQNYLSELFLRHSDIAFRTSKRITKNAADAEDVVQISFIEVIKTHQKFRQEGSFLSWFLKIISHRSLDRLRSDKRRSSRESQAMKIDYYEDKALENDAKQKEVIESHLSLLPSRYREPIYMKIIEGLSTREVSKILAKPEKTIRTQITRGLEKLKVSLKTSGVTLSVLMISNLLSNLTLEAAPASLISSSVISEMSAQIEIGGSISSSSSVVSLTGLLVIASTLVIALFTYLHFMPEDLELLEASSQVVNTPPKDPIVKLKINGKKSFFADFNKESPFDFMKIKKGSLRYYQKRGIKETGAVKLPKYSIYILDISEFKLPIKISYKTDLLMPMPGKTSGPSFVFFEPKGPLEKVHIYYGFHVTPSVDKNDAGKWLSEKHEWMGRVVYIFEDRVETWSFGALNHIVYSKKSNRILFANTAEIFMDNLSIDEIDEKDVDLDPKKVKAMSKLNAEAVRHQMKSSIYPVQNKLIKKLFRRKIYLNIINYNTFLSSFKNNLVGSVRH